MCVCVCVCVCVYCVRVVYVFWFVYMCVCLCVEMACSINFIYGSLIMHALTNRHYREIFYTIEKDNVRSSR